MEFCENCGKMLIPAKKGKKRILICPKCKFEKDI
ncbi:MAG: DNA-directed RNA polymerase subunit M, partial [Candidatus Heimdallarchaeaceae archaeon]